MRLDEIGWWWRVVLDREDDGEELGAVAVAACSADAARKRAIQVWNRGNTPPKLKTSEKEPTRIRLAVFDHAEALAVLRAEVEKAKHAALEASDAAIYACSAFDVGQGLFADIERTAHNENEAWRAFDEMRELLALAERDCWG